MLPSKDQLFKTINCPFYEADPESCNRPYCHFKHSKSENSSDSTKSAVNQQNTQSSKPPIPVYIPTPKHILEGRKSNGSTSNECSVSKRPKLEYVPKAITNQNEPIPTYIPSSVPNPMANDEYEPTPIFGNDNAGTSNVFGGNVNSNGDDIIGLLTELSSEQITNNENRIENIPNNDTPKIHDSTDLATKKSKENSHKSSSSSSSSRHRHHSSSSSHKSSHSERKSSSSSSTHKSSHRSSRKSKHSDRDKDRDKDKSKHSSKSSKDSRHKSEHRSKSSSSSSSSRHHSDKKTHSSNNGNSNKSKDCINSTVVYETDSEEDDVEAQCRMIFDEFDTSTVEIKPDDMPNNASTEEEETPTKIEDVTKKKRVAHDNADKQNRLLAPFKKQADHVKNALQSVFMRQEIVRKQNESKFAEERKEKEKRDLLASLESDKPEPKVLAPKQNLTPLIPPAALVAPKFPPKIFSPVSNMLAIERAKEKVMQLKAQKIAQHQQFLPKTIAQTTPKGTGRVAHTNTNAIAAQNTKPAPPVLEPTSTKISYNIRMQYYNLMVKHCLTIYDDCNDAWERAQTEELAVFQKCKTPVIYKSSALLTINKLRKESLDAGNINTEKNKVISHDVILAGKHGQNTSWNLNRKPSSDGSNIVDSVASSKAYEMIADLCMTDEQLKENGYPRSGNRPGSAVIHKKQGAAPANPDDRYCRRCGKVFKLDEYDEECIDRCNYHPKSPGFRRGN